MATSPNPPKPAGGLYILGGIEGLAIGSSPYTLDPAFSNVQGRIGYALNEYIAVEAQASFELTSQQFDSNGTIYEGDVFDLDSAYGAFVVPRLPVGPYLGIYGRLGYVTIDYHRTPGISGTINGAAFGGGLDFRSGMFMIAGDLSIYPDSTASFSTVVGVKF